jgi:hypothetical protein
MPVQDKIRVLLSPLYLVAGIAILVRGWRLPLGWILGLAFSAYGIYRLRLVTRRKMVMRR